MAKAKVKEDKALARLRSWQKDWNKFCREALDARLDREQQDIIAAVQEKPLVAVASGTARGKDFVGACAALCFLYLTPRWKDGKLVRNTKVALTAPTYRQVHNIMTPEIRRLWRVPGFLPGRLTGDDIRTKYDEWFLTGFKADDNSTEVWSGFHAANTMFVVTEATGISETIFNAIEGNLQGNSRMLIVFNPNITTGYAAKAMKSPRFEKFRLNSLYAENVVSRTDVIPGQVDYTWVKDKVETWCVPIAADEADEGTGDFRFEGEYFRPNDLFRVKVLGMFPRAAEDVLIPYEWVEMANLRWRRLTESGYKARQPLRLGVDVAGMGRDRSAFVYRRGNYVEKIDILQSHGADHMRVAGITAHVLEETTAKAFIDTIGEGAGVYARCRELNRYNAFSCKFSENAHNLHDITGEYAFVNMRAYLYWAMREWLDPKNAFSPALPPDDELLEELTDVHWLFRSDGKIIIEKKDDIKRRLRRSPDKADALANTFYPRDAQYVSDDILTKNFLRK
ncbi:MAG: hypothetical protein LUC22_03000 [Prevotella sp.]|nr:hypothetical protein [Prevotella sp.]